MIKVWACIAACGVGLLGCATVTSALDPQAGADTIASSAGFEKRYIPAGDFTLCSYSRIQKPGEPLTVYVEGDGLAWKGSHRISDDPTPLHPLVLRLASADPSANVVYLSRPGQYLEGGQTGSVKNTYWTDRRFSEEVIAGTNAAVEMIVKETRASRVDLIGYSGGGAVAILVADRRTDVRSIRTIGGNLDPAEVNRIHAVSPLAAGPDPMLVAGRLRTIPQRHFVGDRDTVVPEAIAERFKDASGDSDCVQITRVEDASHQSGWVESWDRLRALPVECGNSD